MENIRLLPDEYIGRGEVRGFHFKKIMTDPRYYVYQVTDGNKKYFELIKRYVNGNRESYPTSKMFGIKAWTSPTLERIEQLIKEKFE